MFHIRILYVAALLLLLNSSSIAQDPCYVFKQACFSDAGLSSTDVNVACPLLSNLESCLDTAACTANDAIANAVIAGAFAKLQKLCEDNLCLSKFRSCVPIWDEFGENLVQAPLVDYGWCKTLALSKMTCSPTIPADCELVGLKAFADIATSLYDSSVSSAAFCTGLDDSCIGKSLLCYPNTILNFAAEGQNIVQTCRNETDTVTCLSDYIRTCNDLSLTVWFPGKLDSFQSHCAAFSVVEAKRCFASISPLVSDPIAASCSDDSLQDCVENALQLPSSQEDQATIQALLSAITDACEPTGLPPNCKPDLSECFDEFCKHYPIACEYGSSEEGGSSELSGTSELGDSSEEWIRRQKRRVVLEVPSKAEMRKLRKKKCFAAIFPLTCVVEHLTPCPLADINPEIAVGYEIAKKLEKYYKKHCGYIPGIEILHQIRK